MTQEQMFLSACIVLLCFNLLRTWFFPRKTQSNFEMPESPKKTTNRHGRPQYNTTDAGETR